MKCVLFCNQKGGVGKTVAADEFAFSLERTGVPFSFFDLDGQGGVLHATQDNPEAEVAILDTPGALQENMRKWMRDADVIVIPTRPTLTDIPALNRTQRLAREVAPETPIIFLLNCVNSYSASKEFEAWFFDQEIFKGMSIRDLSLHIAILPQSEKIVQARNRQMSVVTFAPRDRAAYRMISLSNLIRLAIGLPTEDSPKYK